MHFLFRLAKLWRWAPDFFKLSNVGPTFAQLRHSDRDNINHYTTLGQPQRSDHDNRKKCTLSKSLIYTTKGDACVCVFAKLDQFLPVRPQFDSNQHVNSVRTPSFQSANFGPLLFAFYCPLLFYENKIKNE